MSNYTQLFSTPCSRVISEPVPMSLTNNNGFYIVPAYTSPGYSTLTSEGRGEGGGNYFKLTTAYGKNSDTCQQQYLKLLC
jgi:hypothetical protein